MAESLLEEMTKGEKEILVKLETLKEEIETKTEAQIG